MATGRCGHAVAVLDGKLYVAGGDTVHGLSNSVHRYDPAANAWEEVASMNCGRSAYSAAVRDGRLYVAGGEDEDGSTLASVERYDPSTNTWEAMAPMSNARKGFVLLCA